MGEWRLALRRFARRRAAVVGAVYLVLLVAGALLAPVVAPYDPIKQDLGRMLTAPSSAHPLGTDDLGRDVLTRLLYGARLSLGAACLAVAIATLAGVPIGLVAGYLGGAVDDALMRVIDALQAFPALILAMAIAAALGPGLFNVMVAVGIVYTPRFARLVRGQVLRSARSRSWRAPAPPAPPMGACSAATCCRTCWPRSSCRCPSARLRAAGRDRAVLPGRGHQAAGALVGHRRRARLPLHAPGPIARLHAGDRDPAHRARLQPGRRRHSRRIDPRQSREA